MSPITETGSQSFTFVADPMDLDRDGTSWTVLVLDATGDEVDGWALPTDDNGDREDDQATGLVAHGWRRVGPFDADNNAPVIRA